MTQIITQAISQSDSRRCWWCGDDELYRDYHDLEWGVPVHDERELFEFLCLEGAQAGLSWITILRKREHYRKVFDNFDANKIARYQEPEIAALLQDPGIVRNKLKVNGFVNNARAYLEMQQQGLTLDGYLWGFVPIRRNRMRWPKTLKNGVLPLLAARYATPSCRQPDWLMII